MTDLISGLPYRVRETIIGYAESVDAAAPSIFAELGQDVIDDLRDDLVYVCAVARLWRIVDSQYRILVDGTAFLETLGIEDVRVGSSVFGRGTPDDESVRRLRTAFQTQLTQLGLFAVVRQRSPREMLATLIESRGARS